MADRLPREQFLERQALEEARKAGTAPPEVDEDGNEINPHIPQYISQAPWYLENSQKPGLKHQRLREAAAASSINRWYNRQQKGARNLKWKKGACENCGATTHTTKECCERPRKRGAKLTGQKLARDDVVENLDLDYDGKRDRWNGYDPSEHALVMKRFEAYEEERKKARQKELADQGKSDQAKKDESGSDSDSDSSVHSDENAEYREDEAAAQPTVARQTHTFSVRTSVRNLRIREDTAKYLMNLDVNSAYFDPKTRSMREDPLKGQGEADKHLFRGDNYNRFTGQTNEFNQLQLFAWDAQEKGSMVHAQAAPSQAELMSRQFKAKKDQLKKENKSAIIERYGGEEHLESLPKPLLQQSEHYVEYSRTGKVLKGQEKAVPKSKYEEDVHPANHSSVWGSYWANGRWGYACCKQTHRNAYCLKGSLEAAEKAIKEDLLRQAAEADAEAEAEAARADEGGDAEASRARRVHWEEEQASGKGIEGIVVKQSKKAAKKAQERKDQEEKEKLQRALMREEWRKAHPEEKDERKRKYNSMVGAQEVDEAEMEAWRMKKGHWEDPMAQ